MSPPVAWIGACLAGFISGSIPVGLWWGRLWKGIDVRQHGSRNLGATNVFRTLGPAHGAAVLVLDILKGSLPTFLGRLWTGDDLGGLVAGLCAVVGHIWTPWASFRGGKGVATGLGIWLVLAPVGSLIALAVWGATLGLSRRVSAGSLLATAVLPVAVVLTGPDSGRGLRGIVAGLTALLVWLRHAGNIRRLARGTEPPLWGR